MKFSIEKICGIFFKSKLLPLGLSIKHFLSNLLIEEQNDSYIKIRLELGFYLNKSTINELQYMLINYWNSTKFAHYILKIHINLSIDSHQVQLGLKPLNHIKNIIAIASCKGGVGKSITTSNLARVLSFHGAKVGILDGDIHGSSQPILMNALYHLKLNHQSKITPIVCSNIKMISIGNLVDINSSVIWRGPMVSNALMHLLSITEWGALDYLLIDLPPGTGDVQLTMTKKIPITGVVIVTTTNELALVNTKRSIMMFNKTNINVIGLINNMSTHVCKHCAHISSIFGNTFDLDKLYDDMDINHLGSLPLDSVISNNQCNNNWQMFIDKENAIAMLYQHIAFKIVASIARLPKII